MVISSVRPTDIILFRARPAYPWVVHIAGHNVWLPWLLDTVHIDLG